MIAENKEKLKNYHKNWYRDNKNWVKEYQQKNKEKISQYHKNWREKNREYNKKRLGLYYLENKEKMKAYSRDYFFKNRIKMYAKRDKRYLLVKKLGGKYTARQWRELLNGQNHKCNICQKITQLQSDHIIPISKWEKWYKENKPNYKCSDIFNIQALCESCNLKKGASLLGK